MSNITTLVAPIKKAKVGNKKAITSYLETPIKGAVVVSNLPSNVTGAQVEKVKKQLGALISAKIEANNSHKAHIFGFKFNLDSFKTRGAKYLSEFNSKNGLSVSMAKVMELTSQNLCDIMSEKEKERQSKNGNVWKFWQIETLVARYFTPVKVAKVKKAK